MTGYSWAHIFYLFCLLTLGISTSVIASPYFEVGTSMGKMVAPGPIFQKSYDTANTGFVTSFSFYVPYKPNKTFHFDIGIQNRLTMATADDTAGTAQSITLFTPNIAVRAEFWRIFLGAGYCPMPFTSKEGGGLSSLRPTPKTKTYFLEGGLIWRVIPEFQIVLASGFEFGTISGTGSPDPSIEYGLRFRFPLSPKDFASRGAVEFDGVRYPFGIMR